MISSKPHVHCVTCRVDYASIWEGSTAKLSYIMCRGGAAIMNLKEVIVTGRVVFQMELGEDNHQNLRKEQNKKNVIALFKLCFTIT